ncbi:NaeI family type II restriction endonuclease [Kitasatospora sp. NPDC028055]|uniref:NaeI family type II restriction endonuclease n=1 Tax=Kitasatospora sp. NPDC028055 TaxID=3155653 RepID=UPI0033D26428
MTSDPAQPPSDLGRLLEVLDRAGGRRATAPELAETIWLASRCRTPTGETPDGTSAVAPDEAVAATSDAVPSVGEHRSGSMPPHASVHEDRLLLHQTDEASEGDRAHALLSAPLPPMLAHPLGLQRALRPLRRRVPSRRGLELDELGTAHRIAHHNARPGAWLPVLRPRTERWLTLYLVFDAGPTMPIWRPLLGELQRTFEQTGAFERISLLDLAADGRLHRPSGRGPASLPPSAGRTVTLVLSDCSGPAWHVGSESAERWYRTLHRWARSMPVAVVQPLPERLWRRTALRGAAGLLTARGPASPNSALRFTAFDGPGHTPAGMPLPILEPSARWFGHWAELVAGAPGTGVPGVAAALPPDLSAPVPEPAEDVDPRSLEPERLVLNFRAHASPQALRLAGHLAAGGTSLPVMRLVQAATEVRPEPQHLAEVVLSGMLTTEAGSPAEAGRYVFRPGVQEVLLRMLPRSEAARIGEVIRRHAGSRPGELPVVVPGIGIAGAEGRSNGEPVTAVTEETLRRLGGAPAAPAGPAESRAAQADAPDTLVDGRYRLREIALSGPAADIWSATDEKEGKEVGLKLFGLPLESWPKRQGFLADARRLAGSDIPGLVPVHGWGFHNGRPYLVTLPAAGAPLGRPLIGSGPMPWEAVRGLAMELAGMLDRLHLHGLAHLDLSPSTIASRRNSGLLVFDPGMGAHGLSTPDTGAVEPDLLVLSGPAAPYRSPESLFAGVGDNRSDLYSLGCLLHAMATGRPPITGSRHLRNAWAHRVSSPHPKIRSGISPEFDALVTQLLAFDPLDRPSSASEVMRKLASMRGNDLELDAVERAMLAADPDGSRMGRALRESIDEVLDGARTGRFDLAAVSKVEKVYLGTRVEINVQHAFPFNDGNVMDYEIAGVEVDCKFSQRQGSWLFPHETTGRVCLLIWADDQTSRWSAGLIRADSQYLSSLQNRDGKSTLAPWARSGVRWLWRDMPLKENILLHMPPEDREAVMHAGSAVSRILELFRRVQRRPLDANCLQTVAQQGDYPKRVRDARVRLRDEGIVVIGSLQKRLAERLGLPVPDQSEWVSARLTPVTPHHATQPSVELDGVLWTVAHLGDPVVTIPRLDGRQSFT